MATSGIRAGGKISRDPYGPEWAISQNAPIQSAVYNKIESVIATGVQSIQLDRVAGEPISALRLLYNVTPEVVGVASCNDAAKVRVTAISLSAALTGEPLRVLEFGDVRDPFFHFPSNQKLFLDAVGAVTADWQPGAFSVLVGVSLGNGGMLFRPQPPVALLKEE